MECRFAHWRWLPLDAFVVTVFSFLAIFEFLKFTEKKLLNNLFFIWYSLLNDVRDLQIVTYFIIIIICIIQKNAWELVSVNGIFQYYFSFFKPMLTMFFVQTALIYHYLFFLIFLNYLLNYFSPISYDRHSTNRKIDSKKIILKKER